MCDDGHMVRMDEKSRLSMNGARVAEVMSTLVPDLETFRRSLRWVKYWAKQRGIYSNVFGYLGGFSWSLLVAYVCKQYPECKTPTSIIIHFFRFFLLILSLACLLAFPWTLVELVCSPGDMLFQNVCELAVATTRVHRRPVYMARSCSSCLDTIGSLFCAGMEKLSIAMIVGERADADFDAGLPSDEFHIQCLGHYPRNVISPPRQKVVVLMRPA